DGLLARFGRAAPATGFVVQLDLVSEMLTRAARPPELPRVDAAIAWRGAAGLRGALRVGSTLRLFGMRAVVDTESRSQEAARNWWEAVGAANLIFCAGGSAVRWPARRPRARRRARRAGAA